MTVKRFEKAGLFADKDDDFRIRKGLGEPPRNPGILEIVRPATKSLIGEKRYVAAGRRACPQTSDRFAVEDIVVIIQKRADDRTRIKEFDRRMRLE